MFAKLSEWCHKRSKKPWARFVVSGIENDQVKFDMAWNKAFIKNIDKYGFTAENEETSVQNFLFGSLLIPKDIFNEFQDDGISPDFHPNLSKDTHQFKR